MITRRFALFLLTLLLFLGLGGCASWFSDDEPEPQVHLVKVEVVRAKLMEQRFLLFFRVDNPRDSDLTVRGGMEMAVALVSASELDSQRQAAGFNQDALDEAARRGFGNGAFEDSEEDVGAIVDEFYPEGEATAVATMSQLNPTKPSLAEKLDAQAARQTPPTDQNQGGRHAPAQAESQ